MSNVAFWHGMTKAQTVELLDKILLGRNVDGKIQYADFSQLIGAISASVGAGIEPTAEPNSTLPAPELAGKIMIMKGGTYTQPGSGTLTAPANSFNVGFWDGGQWTIPISVEIDADLSAYAQSGGSAKTLAQVDSELKPIISKSINLANCLDFKGQTWVVNGAGFVVSVDQINWISVQLNNLIPSTVYNLQGYGASISGGLPMIMFSDIDNQFISQITKSEIDLANGDFTTPATAYNAYIRVANEVNIGLNPTNNAFTSTLMVSQGSGSKDFERYGTHVLASVIQEDYPKMFVELIPVTAPYVGNQISQEVGRIYERLREDLYACHSIRYQYWQYEDYTAGDFHGGKIIRYAGSKLVTYNKASGTFSDMGQVLVITAESEFVISAGGWTGGHHGNENTSVVRFLIDNQAYNPSGDVDFTPLALTPCNSFSLVVASELVIDGTQEPLAERKKVVTFDHGGYHVTTRLKWLQSRSLSMYSGICCVSKEFDSVTADSGEIVIPTGGGDFLVDNDDMSRAVFYRSDQVELTVTSRVFADIDSDATLRIWDRANDTKYYRLLPTAPIALGGVLELEQNVTIK